MTAPSDRSCHVVRAGGTYDGKQGFSYFEGISHQSVGSDGICMHLLTIPPGKRARAHMHESHETAIYILLGEAVTYWGDKLQNRMVNTAGDMVYIPAGVPHLPMNIGSVPCSAVITRTDPNEQESVVLLPELEQFVPE